jgi:hypothetical protein
MNELKLLLPSKSSQAIRKKAKELGLRYDLVNYVSPEKFYRIKRGANTRNIEFTIDMRDISEVFEKQNKKCALSGKELSFDLTSSHYLSDSVGVASVDRIESSKSYTKDNIQIVDKYINIAKNTLTNEQFIEMCGNVSNFNRKKNENGH